MALRRRFSAALPIFVLAWFFQVLAPIFCAGLAAASSDPWASATICFHSNSDEFSGNSAPNAPEPHKGIIGCAFCQIAHGNVLVGPDPIVALPVTLAFDLVAPNIDALVFDFTDAINSRARPRAPPALV